MGRKNVMRTSEEKEKILLEFYNTGIGRNEICRKYNIATSTLSKWREKYETKGLDGLKSNTGKHENKNAGIHLLKPKNKIEALELEIMKRDIEIARLKKGYIVKGDGAEKEFVTTFDKNIK